MDAERLVGGLRCRDVLADLSDYLDDTLAAARRQKIEDHLRGCDRCTRFGHRFAGAVKALREQLGAAGPLDAEVTARLKARVRRETGGP